MNRNTLILGSVAILFGVLYLLLRFGEFDRNSERIAFPERPAVVQIDAPQGTLTLRRTEESWRLSELDAPASPELVEALLDPITGEQQLLLAATDSAGGYGLAGESSVTITLQGDEAEATVILGTTSASGRQVYLTAEPREKVYLIDRRVREIAESGSNALRDKVLQRTPEEEIESLRITTSSGREVRIFRREEEISPSTEGFVSEKMARIAQTWEVDGAPLEPYQLENLFQELSALRANSFEDNPQQLDAASSGQDEPVGAAELVIRLRDGSEGRIRIVPLQDNNRYQIVGPELPDDAVILPWKARRLTVGLLSE